MKIIQSIILVSAVGAFASCSDSSSTSAPGSLGAAIGGMFAGSGEASRRLPVASSTCGEFEGAEGSGGGPEGVSTSASITAGTYGSADYGVTVTADQDCESDSEGTGSYASFTLTADVEGTCTGSTTVTMKSGSTGIFRNTDDYEPEIHGTFNFEANGTTWTGVKCTIRMQAGGAGTVVPSVSSCEDSSGGAISLDSDDTCTFG